MRTNKQNKTKQKQSQIEIKKVILKSLTLQSILHDIQSLALTFYLSLFLKSAFVSWQVLIWHPCCHSLRGTNGASFLENSALKIEKFWEKFTEIQSQHLVYFTELIMA